MKKQPAGTSTDAFVSAEQLRLLMQPDTMAAMEQAHQANVDTASSASGQAKMFAVLPHGTDALDSYAPFFWSLCFPCLFPYGDSVDGLYRRRKLPDWDWANYMLSREDRPRQHAWRLHKDFIAVLFSTMHRRHILRSVRLKVQNPGRFFMHTIDLLVNLKATDWDIVADTIGDHGGVEEALKSPHVRQNMKQLLRSMRLVQARVPCTDGSRSYAESHA